MAEDTWVLTSGDVKKMARLGGYVPHGYLEFINDYRRRCGGAFSARL